MLLGPRKQTFFSSKDQLVTLAFSGFEPRDICGEG